MPRPDVALGDRHHQAQVGLGQRGLGVLAVVDLALQPTPLGPIELVERRRWRSGRPAARPSVPGLDALGQVDLFLRGEQRDPADLLEVHPHRDRPSRPGRRDPARRSASLGWWCACRARRRAAGVGLEPARRRHVGRRRASGRRSADRHRRAVGSST